MTFRVTLYLENLLALKNVNHTVIYNICYLFSLLKMYIASSNKAFMCIYQFSFF